MKKLIFPKLIWLLVIIPLFVKGQQPFSKMLGSPYKEWFIARSISQTMDGAYIVSGNIGSKGIVFKMDTTGTVLWNKIFFRNFDSRSIVLNQAISTNDSSVIAIGSFPDSNLYHDYALCINLKSNGDTAWVKAFNLSGSLYVFVDAFSVQQTLDSGFVIAGRVLKTPGSPDEWSFVAKFDVSGNLQWAKQFKDSVDSHSYSIKQTPDGGYVIAGHNYFDQSFFALKLFSNGDISWLKNYNVRSSDVCDVNVVNDGLVFCVEQSLIKTDFSGNVVWGKKYNQSLWITSMGQHRFHQTHDKGFIIINGSDYSGSKIVKTDSAGNLIWSDDLEMQAIEAIETPDKGYLIIGNGPLSGLKNDSIPIGLIKTDSLGNGVDCVVHNNDSSIDFTVVSSNITFTTIDGGATFTSLIPAIDSMEFVYSSGCLTWTSINNEIVSQNYNLSLSPNPTSGTIHMQIPEQFGFVKSIEIYNSMGQLQTRQSSETRLDISSYATGLYFVIATNDKGETLRAKVVKE